MISFETEEILRSPPTSLTQLAMASLNFGRLPVHDLLAFFLGHNVAPDERLKVKQVLNRAPVSMIEAAAADLGVPMENVVARAEEWGITISPNKGQGE